MRNGEKNNEMLMPNSNCISSSIYGSKIFYELVMAFTAGGFGITVIRRGGRHASILIQKTNTSEVVRLGKGKEPK